MVAPYEALASVYDAVMDHVDYDRWARYVHHLLTVHGDGVRRVLELGGGTGSLAVRLQPMGPAPAGYDYVLTDGAPAMLREARRKIEAASTTEAPSSPSNGPGAGRPIRCACVDFTGVTREAAGLDAPVDAVVCVYDGLNYLQTAPDVAALLDGIHRVLRPGGVAVVDQSTPANSQHRADRFDDEGVTNGAAYVRESRYDPATRRHVTTFNLVVDGQSMRETHVQRAYAKREMDALLHAAPLTVDAAYDGFTLDAADTESERIHWVLRRPA